MDELKDELGKLKVLKIELCEMDELKDVLGKFDEMKDALDELLSWRISLISRMS